MNAEICPRPHCGGLLLRDDDEWVCKSCARRFTPERLEQMRMAAEEEPALDKRIYELLADGDGKEQERPGTNLDEMIRDIGRTQRATRGTTRRNAETHQPVAKTRKVPMSGSGWTEERRRKFAATIAAKRNGRQTKKTAGGGAHSRRSAAARPAAIEWGRL